MLAEVARISRPTRIPDWKSSVRLRFGLVSLNSYMGELMVMAKSTTAAMTASTVVKTMN